MTILEAFSPSFRNNTYILGSNNTNVPNILRIIGEVVAEDVLRESDQVYQRLLAIARHIQVICPFIINPSILLCIHSSIICNVQCTYTYTQDIYCVLIGQK